MWRLTGCLVCRWGPGPTLVNHGTDVRVILTSIAFVVLGCSGDPSSNGSVATGGGAGESTTAGSAGQTSTPAGGAGASSAGSNAGGSAGSTLGGAATAGEMPGGAAGQAAGGSAGAPANPEGVPADYQLVIEESFAQPDSLSKMRFADPADWQHQT